MKKSILLNIFYCFAFMMLMSVSASATGIADFLAEKEIKQIKDSGYKYFWLDKEAYKYAKNDLEDLRIIDNNNNFVPYIRENIQTEQRPEVETFNLRPIDAKRMQLKDYFDFQVDNTDPTKDVSINYMELILTGYDYARDVKIYGSYDALLWEYVSSDKLYSKENIYKTSIKLSNTVKYNFYRFEMPDNNGLVSIPKISAYKNENAAYEDKYCRQTVLEGTINTINKDTYINLYNDEKLRIHKISFETDDKFRRNYELRLNETEDLQYSGEIYNVDFGNAEAKKAEIAFEKDINNKSISIKISNGNDKPVNIKKVVVTYSVDKIIFKANKEKTYKIYFDNVAAEKPIYEMEDYKSYILKENITECILGKVMIKEKNTEAKGVSMESFYEIGFYTLIVIFIIIGATYVILKFKRKS